MATFQYYLQGELASVQVRSVKDTLDRLAGSRDRAPARPKSSRGGVLVARKASAKASRSSRPTAESAAALNQMKQVITALSASEQRFGEMFHSFDESEIGALALGPGQPIVIVTDTLAVEAARASDVVWLCHRFGLKVIREGLQGKVLFKAPEGGEEGRRSLFKAARAAHYERRVRTANPNFLRTQSRIASSTCKVPPLWNHDNSGNPGLASADVAAKAAWTLTRGRPEVRIAILDEGIDTRHPALKSSLAGEKDFVDGNAHARPSDDDAHGTACAGIVFSRDSTYPGLAPECGLVAVRIAKSEGNGFWIFDDFNTADAIDWAWSECKADVLSNSWSGGDAVDVIIRAINRARTKGRGGKGAVVLFAAGNDGGPIGFPGNLKQVVTVGASNPWDERKSRNSKDGETWWASNTGDSLELLAPGVRIATTDLQGHAGYTKNDFMLNFNGTSAATPHVAAAVGLILSLAPELNEKDVRTILRKSADRLAPTGGRNPFVGHRRLNLYSALRLARRGKP